MNKILHLLNEEFAIAYLRRKALPFYPQYKDIVRIKIKPYKKLIWETTYHVVIGFDVYFASPDGSQKIVPLVCSAHSNEMRDNVYRALRYLWMKKFNNHQMLLPRPLFFSHSFNGTFYEAIVGESLLYYIKEKNISEIERIAVLAAQLFAKLHSLDASSDANFNPLNGEIKTVLPGVENIFKEMTLRYDGKYTEDLEEIYGKLISAEESFFAKKIKLSLIHGDAHPENIIKTGEDSIGLIDFTDLCLADFARDLGTFMQQLEYKIMIKIGDQKISDNIADLFLSSYCRFAKIDDNQDLRIRIKLYYEWTAMRTATYLFLKYDSNEEQAKILLQKVKSDLKLWKI